LSEAVGSGHRIVSSRRDMLGDTAMGDVSDIHTCRRVAVSGKRVAAKSERRDNQSAGNQRSVGETFHGKLLWLSA
jgi:hypothetical protein